MTNVDTPNIQSILRNARAICDDPELLAADEAKQRRNLMSEAERAAGDAKGEVVERGRLLFEI